MTQSKFLELISSKKLHEFYAVVLDYIYRAAWIQFLQLGEASIRSRIFSDLALVAIKISSDVFDGNNGLIKQTHLLWTSQNKVFSNLNS